MKPEEIKLGDWARILSGAVPPEFYLEVIIRTIIVFLLLIASMRLFGKRMPAQINRLEMVALFSLAAAIGVPLQAPDRGLLPAFVIAVLVILLGRLVSTIAFRSEKVETVLEDFVTILVNDGVVDMKKLKGTTISIERLLAQLRSEGVRHLGEVKRLYIEANGAFSLLREEQPKAGLAVIPAYDKALLDEQKQSGEKVCRRCGKLRKDNMVREQCSNCGDRVWVPAIE
jgi:uncharacterized membrane protein YcaP (DUF421 family)